MLEEAVGIPSTDRRERPTHRLYQSLPCAGSDPAQKLLDLGERLPTFIRVVQLHILDDAPSGPRMARECLALEDGSRRIAPRLLRRP